jgi:hypothetical protein
MSTLLNDALMLYHYDGVHFLTIHIFITNQYLKLSKIANSYLTLMITPSISFTQLIIFHFKTMKDLNCCRGKELKYKNILTVATAITDHS